MAVIIAPHLTPVFQCGNSQAVRLPREVRFPASVREVTVLRDGPRLILEPAAAAEFSAAFWEVLGSMPGFRRRPQRSQRRKQIFA